MALVGMNSFLSRSIFYFLRAEFYLQLRIKVLIICYQESIIYVN